MKSARLTQALALVLSVTGCEQCMKRRPVESVDAHPYPTCDGEPHPHVGEVRAGGGQRSGPPKR
ncbi:MAG: hypothetical protein AAGH15_28440, partial [Myxococcota bacterium]